MKISKKTKDNVRLGFISLFNNDACIQGGREKPWYAAVIIAVVSIFIAVCPVSWYYLKQNGSMFLDTPNYGFETGLVAFQETIHDQNISMKIVGEKLVCNVSTVTGKDYIDVVKSNAGTTDSVTLRAYYWSGISATEFTTNRDTIINKTADPNGGEKFKTNVIFFGEDFFYAYKLPNYTSTAGSAAGSFYGDYKITPDGTDLINLVKQDTYGNAYEIGYAKSKVSGENYQKYETASLKAWKLFLDDAHNTVRITSGWTQTGITVAIFAGLTLFMGLMIFLMTRGKNNPFRIYTFWESQAIGYWASFTPALLAMIMSFILPQWSLMFYIFLFGMRIMWLSMKNLRPQQN